MNDSFSHLHWVICFFSLLFLLFLKSHLFRSTSCFKIPRGTSFQFVVCVLRICLHTQHNIQLKFLTASVDICIVKQKSRFQLILIIKFPTLPHYIWNYFLDAIVQVVRWSPNQHPDVKLSNMNKRTNKVWIY